MYMYMPLKLRQQCRALVGELWVRCKVATCTQRQLGLFFGYSAEAQESKVAALRDWAEIHKARELERYIKAQVDFTTEEKS